jgi:tetratricopeptide (TPR) repeat protein
MPSAREEPLANRQLGDFEIVREVGRGGMGVVYEARQVSLNRKVALKVLASGLGLSSNAVVRFHREAEAAARLHHTNIVPVYANGEHDGTHFYAMELIDGPSLDHVLRQAKQARGGHQPPEAATSLPPELMTTGPHVEGSSPTGPAQELGSSGLGSGSGYFDAVARMVADVADALEHAHENGVIHRDVKPSNLLLSPAGRLSINDFGLARMLEQPGMTMTGEFVGTPAYMSPEQITAGRTPLDHRTDIYSLGATLYELLTLQPPFMGERRDQVLAQILHKEPKPPRRVNNKVPVDLETICLKAMEKDPDRRYQTAGQIADDLRQFVHRFAITARRAGPAVRLRKWVTRNPGLAAGLACALLASGAATFFAYRSHRVEQQRLADQERLEQQLQQERRQAAMDKAIVEAMSGDAPAALQAIADAERKDAEPGQLNMLRGLVEHHRGRPKEAIVYLEQADKQLPGSVAVKALLASAYVRDGQFQRSDEMYTLLEQLEPKTPEDHLFLGLGQAETDPVRALRSLDETPARSRQSTVARTVRVIAQHSLALMTGRVEDAEKALDDLRKVDLPDDNLWLLCTRVPAYLAAAHAYGPNDPRQVAALKQATRDVERLAVYRDNRFAVQIRCYYFFARGDDDALLEEVRQARKQGVKPHYSTDIEASVLYRRKQFGEALRVLQTDESSGDETWSSISQGIVLAAIPGRKGDAEKAFADAIRRCKGGILMGYITPYLQLLGPEYRAKSRQAALEIREHSSHLIPNARDRWYHDLLAFHAGLIDTEELLTKVGESRFNQCEGYCYIGLRKLAEGKRADAKVWFMRSIETGLYFYNEYIWCRAFLARIDDPEWLPWVPATT